MVTGCAVDPVGFRHVVGNNVLAADDDLLESFACVASCAEFGVPCAGGTIIMF